MSDEIRINKHLYHYVAAFTDAGRNFTVLKRWIKSKFRWHYDVYDDDTLSILSGERDD